jgi:hypothetical protein
LVTNLRARAEFITRAEQTRFADAR